MRTGVKVSRPVETAPVANALALPNEFPLGIVALPVAEPVRTAHDATVSEEEIEYEKADEGSRTLRWVGAHVLGGADGLGPDDFAAVGDPLDDAADASDEHRAAGE